MSKQLRSGSGAGGRESRFGLLAEDMRILAGALAAVLSLEDGIEVVARVSDGTAVVPAG